MDPGPYRDRLNFGSRTNPSQCSQGEDVKEPTPDGISHRGVKLGQELWGEYRTLSTSSSSKPSGVPDLLLNKIRLSYHLWIRTTVIIIES